MKCNFCNRELKEDEQYISGGLNDVCICSDCSALLINKYKPFIINNINYNNENNDDKSTTLLTPSQIKTELDKCIVGQEEAKRTMAVAIYNHYKRLKYNNINSDINIDKSNICLIGPTGSGKCVCGDTMVKIRNKKTGKIIYDSIDNIINKYGITREHKFIKTSFNK